jgi:hypothetical protein
MLEAVGGLVGDNGFDPAEVAWELDFDLALG